MLVFIGVDDAVSSKRRGTAICVMHDDDILNAKEMLRHRDRTECIDGSSASNDALEKRGGRGDLFALRIRDNVTGIDFAKLPSDGCRNADGAWVIAVDDDCSQGNRLGEFFTHCRLAVAGLF